MSLPASASPLLVGIAGGSGSGKTTLAHALAERLGARAALLEHDSYYKELHGLDAAQRAAVNFDHPDALDNELLVEHLRQLRAGRPARVPCYEFATHSRKAETELVLPRPIVLVEGILVLSVPALSSAFDVRVFVDAAADIRALRRARRDVHERGRTVDSVVEQWLATVRPMHQQFVEPARAAADFVVSGEEPMELAVGRVLRALRERGALATGGDDQRTRRSAGNSA